MRPLFCALLFPLCLFLQSAPAPKLFPIPENMQYEFPGVRLSETDAKLLEKAFAADIAKEDDCDDERPVRNRIVTARLSLGKLGNGIIAKVNEVKKFCFCGTGGCPMFVYVREKDGYRTVAEDFGWAFGVVESKLDVPDLAFASSGGGGLMSLALQRYDGRLFVDYACETLTAKPGFPQEPDDWWDEDKVSVSPCENSVPHSPRHRH
jgi:hypothetical protein